MNDDTQNKAAPVTPAESRLTRRDFVQIGTIAAAGAAVAGAGITMSGSAVSFGGCSGWCILHWAAWCRSFCC